LSLEAAKKTVLPSGVLPRGLSRVQAAAYIGISPVTFDGMIKSGVMPKPKIIGARRVWDRHKLDAAFDELPGDEDTGHHDHWDDVHL
jgi:hypothetical protein